MKKHWVATFDYRCKLKGKNTIGNTEETQVIRVEGLAQSLHGPLQCGDHTPEGCHTPSCSTTWVLQNMELIQVHKDIRESALHLDMTDWEIHQEFKS